MKSKIRIVAAFKMCAHYEARSKSSVTTNKYNFSKYNIMWIYLLSAS